MANEKPVPLLRVAIPGVVLAGMGALLLAGNVTDAGRTLGFVLLAVGGIFLQLLVIAVGVEIGVRNARER